MSEVETTPSYPANRYSISAVSYLNTKPFLYGLQQSSIYDKLNIIEDTPARCAAKLLHNEVAIALVPVAVIPKLSYPHIVSPYCIGAIKKVTTVCLFANVPLHEIETIYLDYQSQTSVLLVQLLCKEFWNIQVNFLPAYEGYEQEINGTTAGVIIGDRVITYLNKFKYNFDLAEAWHAHTQLPFVFAAWVSNQPIDANFLDEFNIALNYGITHKDAIVEQYAYFNTVDFSVHDYWNNAIDYTLDDAKKQALELFLKKINPQQQILYCY